MHLIISFDRAPTWLREMFKLRKRVRAIFLPSSKKRGRRSAAPLLMAVGMICIVLVGAWHSWGQLADEYSSPSFNSSSDLNIGFEPYLDDFAFKEKFAVVKNKISEFKKTGQSSLMHEVLTELKPWMTVTTNNVELLYLRAYLKQYKHEFRAALKDLNRLLELNPSHLGARLTRYPIYILLGEYELAKEECESVANIVPPLTTLNCMIQLYSVSNSRGIDLNQIERLWRKFQSQNIDSTQSSETYELLLTLAEVFEQFGKVGTAGEIYQVIQSHSKVNHYGRIQTVDFLLRHGLFESASVYLSTIDVQSFELQFRKTLLAQKLNPSIELNTEFKLLFMDRVLRDPKFASVEYAYYHQYIIGDKQKAADLALSNWRQNQTAADLLLAQHYALEAQNLEALTEISRWCELHGYWNYLL